MNKKRLSGKEEALFYIWVRCCESVTETVRAVMAEPGIIERAAERRGSLSVANAAAYR